MDARLYHAELIEELSVVVLVKGVSVTPVGYLPEGTRGTVVSVYAGGAAFEVEFNEPLHTLVTVEADGIRAIPELSRERIIATSENL